MSHFRSEARETQILFIAHLSMSKPCCTNNVPYIRALISEPIEPISLCIITDCYSHGLQQLLMFPFSTSNREAVTKPNTPPVEITYFASYPISGTNFPRPASQSASHPIASIRPGVRSVVGWMLVRTHSARPKQNGHTWMVIIVGCDWNPPSLHSGTLVVRIRDVAKRNHPETVWQGVTIRVGHKSEAISGPECWP